MQILDVYTKKEYECFICKKKIYYAKVARDSGVVYTTDGNLPNGKFAKESNVLSCQVDALNKEQIHSCSKEKLENKIKEIDSKEEPKAETPKAREMDVVDFGENKIRSEIKVNLKILKLFEEEVTTFLPKDSRGDKIGMWMKLLLEMGSKIEVKKN